MTVYDGHMHIWGSEAPDPARLIGKMEEAGAAGGCVFSIDPEDSRFTFTERMDNLFGWVKGYEDRLFPVAWMHPYEEKILDKVKEAAARGVCAFKFIADNYHVGDQLPQRVFHTIAEMGLPVFFHSGILYDLHDSSRFNHPEDWEAFVDYGDFRFSLAHCSFPWCDESIAVYGKYRWMEGYRRRNIAPDAPSPAMYLDTAPGPKGIFRRELFGKLFSQYPDAYHVFFGSDLYVEWYAPRTVSGWIAEDARLMEEAGAEAAAREAYFSENVLRFIGKK